MKATIILEAEIPSIYAKATDSQTIPVLIQNRFHFALSEAARKLRADDHMEEYFFMVNLDKSMQVNIS
jgi:hypothetical protein